MRSQIEHDIEKRVIDKLALWLKDSCALCEMAQLSNSRTTVIIVRSLLFAMLSGLIQKGASKADVMEIISTNWDMIDNLRKQGRLNTQT